ncbi:MAG: glycosyltransferase family 39 protein [Victivallaceae bacterium]|jgi:4-amino-4-deoxy-L-arabinose transferase-like glycosyltransferase
MNSKSLYFLNRNFSILIYVFYVFCSLFLLYAARSEGLLPRPLEGTDQLSMLRAAVDIYQGKMPDQGYMYSPVYTLFLFVLEVISQGNLVVMRALQALLCALIPVVIYRVGIKMRIGRPAAQLAAVLYCFYGPALLVSLDFLREVPLALGFIVMTYFLISAFYRKSICKYMIAGALAGLCILGRENFIPVVLTPAALLLLKDVRKYFKLKYAAGYIAAMALVVMPVLFYNYFRFDHFAIIPGHVDNVIGAYHGEQAVKSASFAAGSILKNIPVQLANYVSSYEIANSLSVYSHREVIDFFKIFLIPFNLLIALAVTALAYKFRNRAVILVAVLIAGYVCSMVFFEMFYRFRIPTVPLLCVLAGSGIAFIISNFECKNYVRAGTALLLTAIVFIPTWKNSDKLRPAHERRSTAAVLIQSERYAAAEDYIDNLRAQNVPTEGLETFMIKTVNNSGDPARARILFDKWIKPALINKQNQAQQLQRAGPLK